MEEKDFRGIAVDVAKIDARSKSNEKRLNEHDSNLKELREKQDAIYELTSSVKSIATDMTYIKEDVQEVKQSQKELTVKVSEVEKRPAVETKRRYDNIIEKAIILLVGGVLSYLFFKATGITL